MFTTRTSRIAVTWPGVAGARRFAFLLGITATGKYSDVAAPLLHRMSPLLARNGRTDRVAQCLLSGAKRKTYARMELFRF
jgi:hypothetical protein